MSCDLFIFAGEKSGDLHGEKLIKALRGHSPGLRIAGVGGPRMRSEDMDCILPMEEFQVMGFIDVFCELPKLIRHFHFITAEILRLKPKAVITIDYPGFNLRLVKRLRKRGYEGKCIHFICPSVWAWGKKRIPLMANTLDLLLSILPFEKELFSTTSLPVSYVGHPLVERMNTYTYKPFPQDKKVIALFPGSRKKEIENNLPLQLDVCREIPHVCIALSVSEERFRPLILGIVKQKNLDVTLVPSDYSYELMRAAHIAIAKSGTVTLELALHRVPTVVMYKIRPLDEFIALQLFRIRLPFYCLVNIIAQKQIYPELFGSRLTYDSLKSHTLQLFDDKNRTRIQQECTELIYQLSDLKTGEESAEKIFQLLNSSSL